jgi:hypothetical protein
MNRKQRIVSSTILGTLLVGAGAPIASATVQHSTPRTVAAVSAGALAEGETGVEYYPEIEYSSQAEAQAEGERVALGKLSALKALLKRSPALFKSAVKAAKKGYTAFMKWVNGLSNFNPVKWAIKASPEYIIVQLIEWLVNQVV